MILIFIGICFNFVFIYTDTVEFDWKLMKKRLILEIEFVFHLYCLKRYTVRVYWGIQNCLSDLCRPV